MKLVNKALTIFTVSFVAIFIFFGMRQMMQENEASKLKDISELMQPYSVLDTTKEYLTNTTYTDDQLRSDHLDLGTVKIVTNIQTGTGYFSDIDEENNELYVTTNAHVVTNEETGLIIGSYIAIQPTVSIERISSASLCGEVVSLGNSDYGHNVSQDVATVRVYGYEEGTGSSTYCKTFDFQLEEIYDAFKLLEIKATNNIKDASKTYYSNGYPLLGYTRNKLIYYSTLRFDAPAAGYDNPNADYYLGLTMPGQSGSAIVDENLNLVSTLFGSTHAYQGYGVSTIGMVNYWSVFCSSGDYANLRHCQRMI